MQSKNINFYKKTANLVADDWGLSKEINASIIHLIDLGFVKRVSVMVNRKYFDFLLPKLIESQINVSLHFNVIEGLGHKMRPATFLRLALGLVKPEVIKSSLENQITKIRTVFPNCTSLESHEYIHLIPKIAKLISPILENQKFFNIRYSNSSLHFWANFFSRYCFDRFYLENKNFNRLLTCELKEERPNHLSVIHPAAGLSDDRTDPWRSKRVGEYLECIKPI